MLILSNCGPLLNILLQHDIALSCESCLRPGALVVRTFAFLFFRKAAFTLVVHATPTFSADCNRCSRPGFSRENNNMDEVNLCFKTENAPVWAHLRYCNQTCSVLAFFKVNVMTISQLNLKYV